MAGLGVGVAPIALGYERFADVVPGPDSRAPGAPPAIFSAIEQANVDEVARLCGLGVNWHQRDEQGRNALDLAQELCARPTNDEPLAARRSQVFHTLNSHGGVLSKDLQKPGISGTVGRAMARLAELAGAGLVGAGIAALTRKAPTGQSQNRAGSGSDFDPMLAFPVGGDLEEQGVDKEYLAQVAQLRTVPEAKFAFEKCVIETLESLSFPPPGPDANCGREYKLLHTLHALRLQEQTSVELTKSVTEHNAQKVGWALAAPGGGLVTVGLAGALLAKKLQRSTEGGTATTAAPVAMATRTMTRLAALAGAGLVGAATSVAVRKVPFSPTQRRADPYFGVPVDRTFPAFALSPEEEAQIKAVPWDHLDTDLLDEDASRVDPNPAHAFRDVPPERAYPKKTPTAEESAGMSTIPTVAEATEQLEECRKNVTARWNARDPGSDPPGIFYSGMNCLGPYAQLRAGTALHTRAEQFRAVKAYNDRRALPAALGGSGAGLLLGAGLAYWVNRWRASKDAGSATVAPPTLTVTGEVGLSTSVAPFRYERSDPVQP